MLCSLGEGPDCFDLEKLLVLLLLYSPDEPKVRAVLLFDLMCNPKNERIEYRNQSIQRILIYIISLVCMTLGNFVFNNSKSLFASSPASSGGGVEAEAEFIELFDLFQESARGSILSDFCLYQRSLVLFPLGGGQDSYGLY